MKSQLEERPATGEKGAATEPEPVMYALTRRFTRTSYGIGQAPSSPTALLCRTRVCRRLRPLKTRALEGLALVRWMVVGSPSTAQVPSC